MNMSLGDIRLPFLSVPGEPCSMDELMALRGKVTARLSHRIKRLREALVPEVKSLEDSLAELRKKHLGEAGLDPEAEGYAAKVEQMEAEGVELLSEELELEITQIELPPECEGFSAKALTQLANFVTVKGLEDEPDPVKIVRKPKLVAPPEEAAVEEEGAKRPVVEA